MKNNKKQKRPRALVKNFFMETLKRELDLEDKRQKAEGIKQIKRREMRKNYPLTKFDM